MIAENWIAEKYDSILLQEMLLEICIYLFLP